MSAPPLAFSTLAFPGVTLAEAVSSLLGQGEVPVREIIDLLAAGYPGWISVEWEKHWHPEIEEPQVALPQYYTVLSAWLADRPETG
jgi:sugar phosphate isomerase/epimerase